MADINFQSRSDEYNGEVLIWESQIDLIMSTKNTTFTHQVRNSAKTRYTIQSLIQAIYKEQFVRSSRASDGKPFIRVPKTFLVEA